MTWITTVLDKVFSGACGALGAWLATRHLLRPIENIKTKENQKEEPK